MFFFSIHKPLATKDLPNNICLGLFTFKKYCLLIVFLKRFFLYLFRTPKKQRYRTGNLQGLRSRQGPPDSTILHLDLTLISWVCLRRQPHLEGYGSNTPPVWQADVPACPWQALPYDQGPGAFHVLVFAPDA